MDTTKSCVMENEMQKTVCADKRDIRGWSKWLVERLVAILFSLFFLLTLFPLLYIGIAIYIKHRSPGPAIVLRPRRRADGHTYRAYRFRLPDEESFLARVPQLINMLCGDIPVLISVRIDEGSPVLEPLEAPRPEPLPE